MFPFVGGSPAKFPPVGGNENQGPLGHTFNPMQGLVTQFQEKMRLGMQNNPAGGIGGTSLGATPSIGSGAPSLAGLSNTIKGPGAATGAGAVTENITLPPPTTQAGEGSSVFPGSTQTFSKEIEDEANSYFQRIYNSPPHPTISIDEVVDMLKRFKDSPQKKEKVSAQFAYVVFNLVYYLLPLHFVNVI